MRRGQGCGEVGGSAGVGGQLMVKQKGSKDALDADGTSLRPCVCKLLRSPSSIFFTCKVKMEPSMHKVAVENK